MDETGGSSDIYSKTIRVSLTVKANYTHKIPWCLRLKLGAGWVDTIRYPPSGYIDT